MSRSDAPRLSAEVEELLADPVTWSETHEPIGESLLAAIAAHGRVPESAGVSSQGSVVDRRKKRPVRAWIGAVAAIALISLIWSQVGTDAAPDAGSFSLEARAAGVDATARAGPAAAGWWVQLEATGLAGAGEGTFYEGWAHDGHTWVSLGTFHMREPGPVSLWSGVSLEAYSHLVVTLETLDGDPSPSGEVVLQGRIPNTVDDG